MQNHQPRAGTSAENLFQFMLWTQGLYYLMTAVWPMVSMESFMAMTGPKTDNLTAGLPPEHPANHWLVMTVAVMIAAIAVTLLVAAWRSRQPFEAAVLAVAAAVGLTGIDVVYVSRGVIAPIYLIDAVAEGILLAGWLAVGIASAARRRAPVAVRSPTAIYS